MLSTGQSSLLKGFLLIGMLGALTLPAVALPDSSPLPAGQPASAGYSASELDLLFKPVALYPDPLLAQLLPAAAFPAQIEAASQWLKANPQGDVDSQPWDASVRALAHYPEVINQLSQDLAWTEAMGHAAATQMADVTGSLQRLRSQAYAAGNLQSNEQQTVTNDENYLTIQPTSPQVIYVPIYNPSLVYSPCPLGWSGSLISFGLGYGCGSWLSYGFDWYGRSCFRYPRGFYYGSYCGPRYNNVSYIHNTYNMGNCNSWRPSYGQSYSSYNQVYRPGNSWARLPGCGSSTGWNQNNFYRPGGTWSSHVGSGWNQPGSHSTGSWNNNSGGNWSRGSNPSSGGWSRQGNYQPGGSWSHNSGSSNGWNQGSNSWTGSRSQGSQGWSGNTSGWSGGGRHSSGFPSITGGGNAGSSWGQNSSGWSGGGRHSSGFPSITGGGNAGSSWGQNSSGWSGGGRHSSGLSFPSGGGRNWSGNTGSNSSGWSGGGRQSSGMSFPSGGGFSSQHSNGGGNWSGSTGQRSSGWNGGGHQSFSRSNGGGGNWSGGGGHGRHR